MAIALVLFIVTYALMILISKWRWLIALISALIFVLIGIIPFNDAIYAIDWNVLMMLAGTMGTVSLFIESKMPNRIADYLLKKAPNVKYVVLIMSLFAGIISAFVDNVATVLMIAPVGLAIAKKLDISPVAMLISISVSSNLQGAATLVGDTTSIMLGSYAHMNFLDFFFINGRPGMFWSVQIGAIATIPVILYLFKRYNNPVDSLEITEVKNYVPTVLMLMNVTLLILASFMKNKPDMINGIICISIFSIGAIYTIIKNKNISSIKHSFMEIDYMTLLLLGGLFIVIEGISRAGVIDAISDVFIKVGGGNLFIMYSLIVWGSVLFSAFIDNIPYVATMLPVVKEISFIMGCSPYILYFGLLIGATLGGNLTPIGASANIATIGILQREGYEVETKSFMRVGVPFTLVAVISGYLFCWIVWGN